MHLFEITVGTHFFKVQPRTNDARALEICYSFVRKFVKVDIQGNNKIVTTFAAANKARSWFRFHFNTLADFNTHLLVNNITKEQVQTTYLPDPVVPQTIMPVQAKWEVRDYQEPIIEYLTKPVGQYDSQERKWVNGGSRARLVGIATGRGKALLMNERIKTPDGWKLNKDIQVGDLITSWDGAPVAVTGVFPQGKIKTCKVILGDGRTLVVTPDHLWGVYIDGDMERQVMTTQDIVNTILGRGGNARIDLHRAVHPDALKAFEELDHGKLTQGTRESGFYCLRRETQAAADEASEIIWAAGHSCRVVKVHDDRFMLFVNMNKGTFSTATTTFVRVDPGDEQEMQCIAIDHPDKLFIAGNWVVTHNTFCAIKAISDIGHKVVVIVLAQYVEKWVKDLVNVMDIKAKEILAVQGGAALQALTEMAVTPGSMDPYKAVVISNRTFENYLRAYENYGVEMDSLGYMVEPEKLWQKLGIGIRLIDEVHMQFHANYRVDLYTHIMRSISLSATLVTRDESMARMYRAAYPPAERYHEGTVEKYTDSFGVLYRVNPNWNVKTSHRGMSSYSHTAFENSVLKNQQFLNGYAKMVGDYLQKGYIQNYKAGNKAIVFAASVDLCGKLADKIQERFPDKTVKRYVSEDPYQTHYLDPDIRVTTIGSGGTGHDIPGLTDNHMTTAIDSLQANIQAFGRLRKIPDQQTRFYFYSCEQVRKHLGYHDKKKKLMQERAKSYTPLFYGTIGESDWTT